MSQGRFTRRAAVRGPTRRAEARQLARRARAQQLAQAQRARAQQLAQAQRAQAQQLLARRASVRRRPNRLTKARHRPRWRAQQKYFMKKVVEWPTWRPILGVGAVITALLTAYGVVTAVDQSNRTLEVTREGQIAERFGKAVEQLSSDKPDVVLGGIYSLEDIAQESPSDQPAVMDVLSAFVRARNPLTWKEPRLTAANLPVLTETGEPMIDTKVCVPEDTSSVNLQRDHEVQAALTAIVTRDDRHDGSRPIDLSDACLATANLSNAKLEKVDLSNSNLYEAHLESANLRDATLVSTILTKTWLTEQVHLEGADLTKATLKGTHLSGAQMQDADLIDACLLGPDLTGASLDRVDLSGAKMAGAKIDGTTVIPLCRKEQSYTVSEEQLDDEKLSLAADFNPKLEGATLEGIYYESDRPPLWPFGFPAPPPSRPTK